MPISARAHGAPTIPPSSTSTTTMAGVTHPLSRAVADGWSQCDKPDPDVVIHERFVIVQQGHLLLTKYLIAKGL